MQKDAKQTDLLSPAVQGIMRSLVSAFRSVKIYPPNNPIYSQSVSKAFKELDAFLTTAPDFSVSVQKTCFSYRRYPVGKDGELNKALAQDLFTKGIREMIFIPGLKEEELLQLCQALALSAEGLAMKNGISSILWEKGAEHIKITEGGLDEVITTESEKGPEDQAIAEPAGGIRDAAAMEKKKVVFGRTLVLGDLLSDPSGFGAGMVGLARQTKAEHESVEDRLFTLYQEAGRKIGAEQPDQSETLFQGLADSALALESPLREGLIAGKLYGGLDAESSDAQEAEAAEHLPSPMQEIQTGRFSSAWNTQQVSTLLKKAASKKSAQSPPAPFSAEIPIAPLPPDLIAIAKRLAEYSPEELAELEAIGRLGMESDIIEASVRTLLSLLSSVRNPLRTTPTEKEIDLFSGVVHQLEDLLNYLLKKKDFAFAGQIIEAFHLPVEPAFQPRMREALKKTAPRNIIVLAIEDLRKYPKESPEYQSAHAYVSNLSAQAIDIILEFLATEEDKATRIFLLGLVKDIATNQIALLGEHLSDRRWYFVRNIVSILGECKTDQSIVMLRKAADHEHIRIREEVIKSLLNIGGKKASAAMAKFLRDKDVSIQLMAIRAFAQLTGIVAEELVPLMSFLDDRPITKKDHALTLEAIQTLGKSGGTDAAVFLTRYERSRWWKSRKLQGELKDAALRAMENIRKRGEHGGRKKG